MQIVDLNTIHIFTDAVMQPDEKIVLEIFNDTGKIVSSEAQMSPSPSQMHTSGLPKILIYIPARQPFYKMELPLILPEPLSESVPSWGKMDSCKQQVRPFRGACIHHDNGVLGACGFHDAECRRVRILKEAGFNAIRSSHNPISKAMLDACDQLGMYIIDEAFDMC